MNKKQQIIQVAIELFSTKGYEKTSIAAICESAKVSKGAVFHHFKNKDELLREVFIRMAEIISSVGDSTNAISDGLTAKEKLRKYLEEIFLSMSSPEQKLYYQLDFQVISQPSLREIVKDLIEERYQLMTAGFQSILSDIPSADSIVDPHMLIAEIDGIALNYLFAEDGYPLKDIKERFINKYLLLLDS